MRIDEFAQPVDSSLPFNVVDDIAIFMRNDPMFYRKKFFPLILKVKGAYDNGSTFDKNEFNPVVDNAVESYCRKFNINKRPEKLMSSEEKNALVDKLYSEEMKMIKDGAY